MSCYAVYLINILKPLESGSHRHTSPEILWWPCSKINLKWEDFLLNDGHMYPKFIHLKGLCLIPWIGKGFKWAHCYTMKENQSINTSTNWSLEGPEDNFISFIKVIFIFWFLYPLSRIIRYHFGGYEKDGRHITDMLFYFIIIPKPFGYGSHQRSNSAIRQWPCSN